MKTQPQVLYLAIAAIIGGVLGFLVSQTIQQQDVVYITKYISEESGEQVVKEKDLPLVSDFLLNPVFYEWWVSARGVLVAKSEDSITLEQDGIRAVIQINEATNFLAKKPDSQQLATISLEDVPLGSKLKGSVLAQKKGAVTIGLNFTMVE